MTYSRKTKLSIITSVMLLSVMPGALLAARLGNNNFETRWVKPDEKILVSLTRDQQSSSDFRFFINKTDVTTLFYEQAPGQFTYRSSVMPLPSGENELIVYEVPSNQSWNEVGRVSLRVLTNSGFERAEVTPTVQLSIDSQLAEGHSPQATAPARSTYADLNLQASLNTEHSKDNLVIKNSVNFVGVSNQESALRFGVSGNNAPKVDLSDYLVDITKGDTNIQLGHVTYGSNPLLLSDLANRGIKVTRKINNSVDVILSSQSGTAIAGYNRITGLGQKNNRISGATIGYEFLPERPGGIRLELSYTSATIAAEAGFDIGEIPVAEKSSGFGLKLTGSNKSGRLQGNLVFARSRYNNPTNAGQEFNGTPIVDVLVTSNNARSANVSYKLLDGYELTKSKLADMTVSFQHSRTDPEYKTLAAFPNSDQQINSIAIDSQLGDVSVRLRSAKQRDNLANIASILTTKTSTTDFGLDAPLQQIFGDPNATTAYWPMLTFSLQRIRQYAGNNPLAADSDFNGGSDLPDQVNNLANLGVTWSLGKWDVGYQFDYSYQDNRQVGRDIADFRNRDHRLTLGFRPKETISINTSLGVVYAYDRENNKTTTTSSYGMDINWQSSKKLLVTGSYNSTGNKDSLNQGNSDDQSFNLQVSYQFKLGSKQEGQFFLRYTNLLNKTNDNLFGFNSLTRNWTVNSGINLTLF